MASEEIIGLNHFGTKSPDSEHARVGAVGRMLRAVPPAVVSRMVVIFGVLALIKLVLLIGLRKHLQEIHWRNSGDPVNWLASFAFYALAGVLVYTLIQFGRQCQPAGTRAVRVANALMLGFGGLLILLVFHEGDKNYLYPIMTGVLKWKDLVPYLSLNLFFRPPYLAAWIFAYVAGYYLLVRSGRERQALVLTATFAGLYWIVSWQEFMSRKSDLWVILIFGLLSMVLLRSSKRGLHPGWLMAPLGWALLIWGLFRLELPDVGRVPPYFTVLSGCLLVLFVAATLVARREGFLRPWVKVVAFCFVAVLLLASANYPKAENFNNLAGFLAKFPHYFLGELFVTGIIAFAGLLYARIRPGGSLWWLDLLGLGVIVLALVDLRLTEIMGVRLGWDVLAFGSDPKMMVRMAKPYLPSLAVAMVIAGLAYAGAVRIAGWWLKRGESKNEQSEGQMGGWCLAGCFSMFAILGPVITKPDNAEGSSVFRLVQTSPLWKRTAGRAQKPEDFFRTARELGMSDLGVSAKAGPEHRPRDLNVLLIFQESTYNQHLPLFGGTRETQPRLSSYKDRMEIFPNFFSSFAGSIHARFATFTGLYPVSDFSRFTLNRVPVKSVFEVLAGQGYECSIFYSSYFDYTGFRDLLKNRQLAGMYDADTMPGEQGAERVSWGLKEESTAEAIRRQIQKYAGSGQRFFLTYIPAAPHYPYDKIPKEFRAFKLERYGDYSPLYLNELLYMDWIITSLVDELKATGLLEKTLVVITSDHGEMLGENGGPMGHGWRVTPQLANVPLIIMDPDRKGYRINEVVGSQVDLLPTLLDSLEIPVPVGELYQGQSLYVLTPSQERRIYLSSYSDFAVIAGKEFLTGSRRDEPGSQIGQLGPVYHISNLGQVTVFTETNVIHPTISIRQFDDFQEGFLRNYAFYRDSLQTVQATNHLHTSR
jgi:hypothetical protein